MRALFLAFALGLVVTAAAQPGGHGTPVLSRLVQRFASLEGELADQAHSHNEAGLGKLLAADFEQRDATAPGRPLPRADWMRSALGKPIPGGEPSQMAVHDYGNVAVVSFLDAAQHLYVVDVWSKTADTYALSVRYASATGVAETPTAQPENPAK